MAWVPFLALITLLPLWFPDGRPPGRFWTAVERLVLGLLVAVTVLCAVEPQVSDGRADNPLPIEAPWAAAAVDVLIPVTVAVAVLLCLPAAVLRYWRTEVLELLARGRANQAIAAELHLSHQTVRNYVSSVFLKLGVADRAEAIVRAREAGLGAAGRG